MERDLKGEHLYLGWMERDVELNEMMMLVYEHGEKKQKEKGLEKEKMCPCKFSTRFPTGHLQLRVLLKLLMMVDFINCKIKNKIKKYNQ